MRAEAAGRAFLDGDQELVRRGQLEDEFAVEGLGEARVGDRGRKAARRELLRRLQGFAEPRAKRQDRDPRALAHDAALADRQNLALLRQVDADALAARIAQARSARNHGRRRSRPYGRVRPRPTPPSPSYSAGRRDRRCRTRPRASRRPRRPARRGRWRSGPAGSGSPRRARAGRSRAAGRSNRSRRTACSLPSPGRRRTSPRAARRCRRRTPARERPPSSGRGRSRPAWRR